MKLSVIISLLVYVIGADECGCTSCASVLKDPINACNENCTIQCSQPTNTSTCGYYCICNNEVSAPVGQTAGIAFGIVFVIYYIIFTLAFRFCCHPEATPSQSQGIRMTIVGLCGYLKRDGQPYAFCDYIFWNEPALRIFCCYCFKVKEALEARDAALHGHGQIQSSKPQKTLQEKWDFGVKIITFINGAFTGIALSIMYAGLIIATSYPCTPPGGAKSVGWSLFGVGSFQVDFKSSLIITVLGTFSTLLFGYAISDGGCCTAQRCTERALNPLIVHGLLWMGICIGIRAGLGDLLALDFTLWVFTWIVAQVMSWFILDPLLNTTKFIIAKCLYDRREGAK